MPAKEITLINKLSPITVSELIVALQNVSPDATIWNADYGQHVNMVVYNPNTNSIEML